MQRRNLHYSPISFESDEPDSNMSTLFGAVITFPTGTTKAQAEAYSEKIRQIVPIRSFEGPAEYEPDRGDPVWYIP